MDLCHLIQYTIRRREHDFKRRVTSAEDRIPGSMTLWSNLSHPFSSLWLYAHLDTLSSHDVPWDSLEPTAFNIPSGSIFRMCWSSIQWVLSFVNNTWWYNLHFRLSRGWSILFVNLLMSLRRVNINIDHQLIYVLTDFRNKRITIFYPVKISSILHTYFSLCITW